MQAGWVWMFFVLGSVLLGLAIFPELRHRVRPRRPSLARLAGRFWRPDLARLVLMSPLTLARSSGAGVSGVSPLLGAVPAKLQLSLRWRWIAWGSLLLLMPLVFVVAWQIWSGPLWLEGFDDRIDPGNRQVAQLLHGEHLVPPPPLPPDVFTTVEVELVRPMLGSADRRWEQMDPEFVQRLLTIFKLMKERHGYEMTLLEGFRSPERQNMLAARGAHVTAAGAWQSYHQYGLAADCAFYRGGKLVISEKDPWAMRGYQLYGELAEELGLTWGGRWQMMDLGHVEWRRPGVKRGRQGLH